MFSVAGRILLAATWLVISIAAGAAEPHPANGVIHGRFVVIPGMHPTKLVEPLGIGGVKIDLADSTERRQIATTTTAADGSFSFIVPPGSYVLTGPNARAVVRVAPGQDVTVDLNQLRR